MTENWPKTLVSAAGPIRADKLDGAAEGMGEWGAETRALAAEGLVQPDMMTGLTLFLLGNQPRDPRSRQAIPGAGGGVAGGVWVRERFTIHRPLARDEAFTAHGESVGRHIHKGRRYGTTSSRTFNEAGEPAATNLTTGLLAYRVEDGLADALEGRSPDEVEAPQPDWTAAPANPCRQRLAALEVGETFGGYPVRVALASTRRTTSLRATVQPLRQPPGLRAATSVRSVRPVPSALLLRPHARTDQVSWFAQSGRWKLLPIHNRPWSSFYYRKGSKRSATRKYH